MRRIITEVTRMNIQSNMRIYCIIFLMYSNCYISAIDDQAKEEAIVVNVENNNRISLADICDGDCTHFVGNKLKECMAYLDSKKLKENFSNLNPRAAHAYLKLLSDEERYEFLSHFSEQEWHEWHQKLDPHHQKMFPETKKEQINEILRTDARYRHYASRIAYVATEIAFWSFRIFLG